LRKAVGEDLGHVAGEVARQPLVLRVALAGLLAEKLGLHPLRELDLLAGEREAGLHPEVVDLVGLAELPLAAEPGGVELAFVEQRGRRIAGEVRGWQATARTQTFETAGCSVEVVIRTGSSLLGRAEELALSRLETWSQLGRCA
jgi:hypothetical protein